MTINELLDIIELICDDSVLSDSEKEELDKILEMEGMYDD
jgi:hypothetical protein